MGILSKQSYSCSEMKLLKAIAPITLLVTASWTAPTIAGEISGKQYVVLRSGPRPIADNTIMFVPCYSNQLRSGKCAKIKKELSDMFSEIESTMDRQELETRRVCRYTQMLNLVTKLHN